MFVLQKYYKKMTYARKSIKNKKLSLHMSKKSSTFAPDA